MAIQYTWDNPEKTVMLFSFEEPWTWQQYYEMKPASDAEIQAVGHPVGCIIDIPKNLQLEPSMLTQTNRVMSTKPTNLVVMVVVTQNALFKAMNNSVTKIFRIQDGSLQRTDTIDEARQAIHRVLQRAKS